MRRKRRKSELRRDLPKIAREVREKERMRNCVCVLETEREKKRERRGKREREKEEKETEIKTEEIYQKQTSRTEFGL